MGERDPGAARRLKRQVFAAERASGQRIAIRLQSEGGRTDYRVTMSALRAAFPERFQSKVDELQVQVRGYLSAIDARIEEAAAKQITEHVEPRLDELWHRDESLAESIGEVARGLDSLSQRAVIKPDCVE